MGGLQEFTAWKGPMLTDSGRDLTHVKRMVTWQGRK